jgi:hypothetical protein
MKILTMVIENHFFEWAMKESMAHSSNHPKIVSAVCGVVETAADRLYGLDGEYRRPIQEVIMSARRWAEGDVDSIGAAIESADKIRILAWETFICCQDVDVETTDWKSVEMIAEAAMYCGEAVKYLIAEENERAAEYLLGVFGRLMYVNTSDNFEKECFAALQKPGVEPLASAAGFFAAMDKMGTE